MSVPLVSVLMTAYNREAFIAEAIESVLASRFQDFELIVVDDGSRDRTLEIARRYTHDPRVRLFVNEQNITQWPNRNLAAAYARGHYLKFLDSDDVIHPHGLQVMVEALDAFPEAGFGLERADAPDRPYPFCLSPAEAYREEFLGAGLFGCGPSGVIMRRTCFEEVKGFRDMDLPGDTDLWLRLGARYPTVKFMRGLVWWRCHPQQITHTENAATLLDKHRIRVEALTNPACPLTASETSEALRRVRWHYARNILRCALRECRFKTAAEVFRASDLSLRQLLAGLLPLHPLPVTN